MSKVMKRKYTCSCGCELEVDIYESINYCLDNELAQKLLNDELTKTVCKNCNEEINLVYPILFNPGIGRMIQYYPFDDIEEMKQTVEECSQKFMQTFSDQLMSSFNPKTIWTQDFTEFKELIKKQIM